MKGQYLTVEYVFFFAIGVLMIIIVYFTFSGITENIRQNTAETQLYRIGENVRGFIINTFEVANSTNSTIYYNVSIPAKVSLCTYAIEFKENLNLNCTDNYKIGAVLNLYGINIVGRNIKYSTEGNIQIINRNGAVEIS